MAQGSFRIRATFLVVGIALIAGFAYLRPIHGGDGLEYHSMLQGWFDHFTPDLRVEDIPHLNPFKEENNLLYVNPWSGFWPARDGRSYCWHFWLYPLFALPAKAFLHAAGANEYAAFQVTNAALYVFALWIVLFKNHTSLPKRLMLAGLAGVSPVIWYLRWPSAEAFTWSFVLISLVLLGNRQYVGAAVAASVAAMQNPPVLFLAAYAVLLCCRERNLSLFLLTTAASFLSFVPNLFFYDHFGQPNVIAAKGGTDIGQISLLRTWSFFTDLNQGLLPYMPLALILSLGALYRMIQIRHRVAAGICLIFFVMVACSELTVNWNSGASGLMRYAVWMIPLVAWFIVELLPATRRTYALIAASIAIQAAVVSRHNGTMTFLEHNALATFALSKTPMLYPPEPDIFLKRQGPVYPGPLSLPFPFITKDYRVTKILTDAPSLARLQDRFIVDPVYLGEVMNRCQSRAGLFYLNPPKGKVIPRLTPTAEEFQSSLRMSVVDVPARVTSPELPIKVTLSNTGNVALMPTGARPYGSNRFGVAHFIKRQGEKGGQLGPCVYAPDILYAGQSAAVPVPLQLPREKGQYVIEVKSVLEGVSFGKEPTWLTVDVQSDPESTYLAEIRVR